MKKKLIWYSCMLCIFALLQGQAQDPLKSYSKFDFVSGENVLFYDDFAQDAVGDFPAKWNTDGSGEVVTLNRFPGNWFKFKGGSAYAPELQGKLPENFTVEFDLIYMFEEDQPGLGLDIISSITDELLNEYVPGKGGGGIAINTESLSANNWKDKESGSISTELENHILAEKKGQIIRISISVQKQRFRLYLNENKLLDIPKFLPADLVYDHIRLWCEEGEEFEALISNFRVAVGAPDMRSKLITEGKLITRGITFDSGSDKIKPESYGTLKAIADVLKGNPDVRVKIVGHTDNVGADEANLDLSKRRAISVRNALVSEFGIDAARIETEGKGETEPISDNATIEGRANNRRVEFIKL